VKEVLLLLGDGVYRHPNRQGKDLFSLEYNHQWLLPYEAGLFGPWILKAPQGILSCRACPTLRSGPPTSGTTQTEQVKSPSYCSASAFPGSVGKCYPRGRARSAATGRRILHRGVSADFLVVDRNPYIVSVSAIHNTMVLTAVIDAEVCYQTPKE